MAGSTSVFECVYHLLAGGQQAMANIVHYVQAPTDDGSVTLADVAVALTTNARSNWNDNIAGLMSSSIAMTKVTWNRYDIFDWYPPILVGGPVVRQKILPRLIEQWDADVAGAITGGVAGDYLPWFNNFRASKKTAHAGRRGRGHLSVPGIPEASTDGNFLTAPIWATWQTNAQVFLLSVLSAPAGDWGSAHFLPVVFSIRQAQVDGFDAAGKPCAKTAYALTTAPPNQKIGSMRRRKVRGGVA